MMYENPNSNRKNPFRKVYDSEKYKNVLKNRDNVSPFPQLVDVELTNHCNLSCIFCGQQTMKRPKGFMTRETFKKVVDECAIHKTPIRFIRWGEPFLHKNIIDFARYIKDNDLWLHITSNGLAIKDKDMESLVDLGVESLVFSFQGATKEQYEIMRNNKRYDELKENVLRMVEIRGEKEKPFIHVSSTMTNETKDEVNEFMKYWGGIVDSVGVGKTNLSYLSMNQIKSFENLGKLELVKKQETIKKEYRACTEVYQKMGINWDGKVTACCADFDEYLIVGDLADSAISDIWQNSEELKAIRLLLDKMKHWSLNLCSRCYQTYDEF